MSENDQCDVFSKIEELFGNEVATRFKAEDLDSEDAIKDLVSREADAPIFSKLQLTYGQALRLRSTFSSLPKAPSSATPNVKPTMGQMAFFTPEQKRIYLIKRKKVGTLAAEHWKGTLPKFNTPERKAELLSFAKQIASECAMPDIAFTEEGIAKHIQTFFNEQRRYKIKKSRSDSNESASDSSVDPIPQTKKSDSEIDDPSPKSKRRRLEKLHNTTPQLPELPKVDECGEIDDDVYTFSPPASSTPSTVSVDNSDDDDSEGMFECSQQVNGGPSASWSSSQQVMASSNKVDNVDASLNVKTCQMIIKAVFKEKLSRDNILHVLKGKFSVKPSSLSTLSVSQLMECLARKLLTKKYCSILENVDMSKLRMEQIQVHKEIAI